MSQRMLNLLVTALVLTGINLTWAAPTADLITDLPGLSYKPNFRQYSGYLSASEHRKLHYWFVESQNDPANDPVVLWLNGGPGCSSLFGLLGENGPFRLSSDGSSLVENKFSWNKVANVIYLEAPADVGFSYYLGENYSPNDNETALDNWAALVDFFTKFQEFKNNDFYLSGESYAGFYIPTLMNVMLDKGFFKPKGFLIGNSLSSFPLNYNSRMYYLYNHGIFSHTLWTEVLQTCCHNTSGCDFYTIQQTSTTCLYVINKALEGLDNLDPYNIYADVDNTATCDPFLNLHKQLSTVNTRQMPATPMRVKTCKRNGAGLAKYLNRPDVRSALHIGQFVQTWVQCTDLDYHILFTDMFAFYKRFITTTQLRIMLFNGDVDSICNFLGDEWFVDALNLKNLKPYRQWFYHAADGSRQVGGNFKTYDRFTYATVRGSGHMVPQDRPAPAFVLFKNFLSGMF